MLLQKQPTLSLLGVYDTGAHAGVQSVHRRRVCVVVYIQLVAGFPVLTLRSLRYLEGGPVTGAGGHVARVAGQTGGWWAGVRQNRIHRISMQ